VPWSKSSPASHSGRRAKPSIWAPVVPRGNTKTGHVALQAGMIVSNEPGYYRAGAYGIRLENLASRTRAW
jgi:Xaa-Pro aminopeptidase